MKTRAWAALATALVLVAGCEYTIYEVEMRPAKPEAGQADPGHRVERRITARQSGSNEEGKEAVLSAEVVAHLGEVYQAEIDAGATKDEVTFSGTFGPTLPNDVGGAGVYVRWPTTMGTATSYVERFRGRIDQAGVLEEEFTRCDRLTDYLMGWFAAHLSGEKGFDQLRTFMDTGLRQDLKNMTLYAWQANAVQVMTHEAAVEEVTMEMAMRVVDYLVERGYLRPVDAPRVARIFIESFGGNSSAKPVMALLQRMVATRMGLAADAPLPEALAFLGDPETVQASFAEYLAGTDEFKARRAAWDAARKDDPEAEEPDPMDLVESPDLIGGFFRLSFGDTRDALTVSLETGAEPWATNGTFDAAKGKVAWDTRLGEGDLWPEVCHALWAAPDEAFQKKHFGKTVLAGKELHGYCLWRAGLSEDEGRQWDAMIAGLDGTAPAEQLTDALHAFRFAGEPEELGEDGEEPRGSYAHLAVGLILQGLRAEDD